MAAGGIGITLPSTRCKSLFHESRGLDGVSDRVAVVFIFGSFALGGQHAGSDVDLMAVTHNGGLTLDEVSALVGRERAKSGGKSIRLL